MSLSGYLVDEVCLCGQKYMRHLEKYLKDYLTIGGSGYHTVPHDIPHELAMSTCVSCGSIKFNFRVLSLHLVRTVSIYDILRYYLPWCDSNPYQIYVVFIWYHVVNTIVEN
jgi:hypothetical protein